MSNTLGSQLYLLNDGYGNFTLGSANFPTGAVWGSIIHDFDNDGYGDILVLLDDIQPSYSQFQTLGYKFQV